MTYLQKICSLPLLMTLYFCTVEMPNADRRTLPGIDQQLRITEPIIGKKVRGKIWIRGKAKPGSSVIIKISGTYYSLGKDMQKERIYKGDGPIKIAERKLTIKADRQGFWKTDHYDFRNKGWSTEFKIVATSVEGKNSTYVIVKDETKPAIAWD